MMITHVIVRNKTMVAKTYHHKVQEILTIGMMESPLQVNDA
jgi:hypothetical protein